MKWKQKLVEFFSLDYRSLALMRFSIGALILMDLCQRAHSLIAHYSDAGVLPRADLLNLFGGKFYISVHMISGLPVVQALLFVIAAIFAVMLMTGYRTRFATIMSWFLLISLQSRNPMIIQGGDIVFRVVLFWMMFLPTGTVWSLDRLFNRIPKVTEKFFVGAASIAYILQIVIIYVMSGVLKTGLAWQDGTAVYYALYIDQLVRPLGGWLRQFNGLTAVLTFATIAIEKYGSILLFSPFKTGFVRTIGLLLFALMQIGFNLSMHLGLFGSIMIVVTLGLLPEYFWEKWWTPFTQFFRMRARSGLTIYYDTDCTFCFKTVHVLKKFLLLSSDTRVLPSSRDEHISAVMARENSWIVVDRHGKMHLGYAGVSKVVWYSPLFFWLVPIMDLPGIRHIGEWSYRKVASSRLAVCIPEPLPHAPSLRERKLKTVGNVAIIFLALYIFIWNVDPNDKHKLLREIDWVAWTTRLDQQFGMFAPTPLTEDGWYVISATLDDGRQVDIFKNGPMVTGESLYPVSYEKPADVSKGYPDQRWQKYLMNISEAKNSEYRSPYGKYLCRTWNSKHADAETLIRFDIEYVIEITPAQGEVQEKNKKINLWSHRCFDDPKELPPTPPNPPEDAKLK
ncbi:MAG: DUF393 domain-containing protein [Candidatus Pacebacteria bacterium]|nr:DUF393 domain-containing protein [Candidatus Paceibacterota bacterium]